MRITKKSWLSLLLALVVTGLAATATAQTGPAARFLKSRHDRVVKVLGADSAGGQNDAITGLIGDLLDYEAVSQAALADHWAACSEKDRAEFVSLLRKLVERSYQAGLKRTLNYEIAYQGEAKRGDKVVVRTSARSRENRRAPEVSIDYSMQQRGAQWVVVDVVTDGVSMVRNYRNQFGRLIEEHGIEGLLERMRKRAEG